MTAGKLILTSCADDGINRAGTSCVRSRPPGVYNGAARDVLVGTVFQLDSALVVVLVPGEEEIHSLSVKEVDEVLASRVTLLPVVVEGVVMFPDYCPQST